jgi:hypothetical protein
MRVCAPMMRFHLNISNGNGFTPDEEGLQLHDLDAARRQAIEGVRSVISDEAKQGRLDLSGVIEITDDDGTVLMVVPFTDALELTLGKNRA